MAAGLKVRPVPEGVTVTPVVGATDSVIVSEADVAPSCVGGQLGGVIVAAAAMAGTANTKANANNQRRNAPRKNINWPHSLNFNKLPDGRVQCKPAMA